jgi:WD40 repeat protein
MTKQKNKRIRGLILSRQGWQKLQDAKTDWEFATNQGNKITLDEIAERAGLTTATIRKILTRNEGVDRRSMVILFSALNLELAAEDCTKPTPQKQSGLIDRKIDWGEAIDVSVFYGRTKEIETLAKWILEDRCRLISVIGIGGIGKTTLSIKITQQVESQFECLIWRSLRDAPPIEEFLINLIQFLSEQPVVGKDIPTSVRDKITLLINCLRSSRCLVVFDNIESLMCDENRAGICADEYQEYSQLFQRLAASEYQSCVLLTTRENPQDVIPLEGKTSPVRSLQLDGLKKQDGEAILQQKGLKSSAAEFANLVERYNGNPLALKIVGTTIRDLFESNVADFLRQDMAIFGDINDLLTQQFQRLLDIEDRIMYWLAINREPITLEQLQADLVDSSTQLKLIDGLESLVRRCLIEKAEYSAGDDGVRFTLQSVVMEYVTNKLIQKICQEINTQELELFRFYALVKATAKDYIKETQKRLILQPLIARLLDTLGCQGNIEQRLLQLKSTLQLTSPRQTGYVAGNILNLLCYLETDLTGVDFSNLCIWQADLQNVQLHDVNFENGNLTNTIFSETFGSVMSVASSPDGETIAFGDSNGEIHISRISDRQTFYVLQSHTNWVVSLNFSSDGKFLASGSSDNTVKLWNVNTGQLLETYESHEGEVWSVVFSSDDKLLATGCDDNKIRLWDVDTGECRKVLQGHGNWVLSVVFSPDGKTLLSGSEDKTIRIWDVDTGECHKVLQGHKNGVRSISIDLFGKTLVSSSDDYTIRIWDVNTGKCQKILQGHENQIFSVALSSCGDTVISGSHDHTIKLWNVHTGKCIQTFQGHKNWVCSVAFDLSGRNIISGSRDQTVKLWNVHTGECFQTLSGYTNQLLSISFNHNGEYLISGGHDCSIRLWNAKTGQCLKTFQGHNNWVYSVAFDPINDFVVSGSGDKSVKLWDVKTGECLKTLQGHLATVNSVCFSSDGRVIASGGEDGSVKLWDARSGQILKSLEDHNSAIWSIAFSPDDQIVASGSLDRTAKLWNVKTGQCFRTFSEHSNWVWCVAFSPDGNLLATTSTGGNLKIWDVHTGVCLKTFSLPGKWFLSCVFSSNGNKLISSCQDCTIRVWNIITGECEKTLSGHDNGYIWSVDFSPETQTIASGSEDGTIRLWDIKTSQCTQTLIAEKPYKNLNCTQVIGLTEATKNKLKILGAL